MMPEDTRTSDCPILPPRVFQLEPRERSLNSLVRTDSLATFATDGAAGDKFEAIHPESSHAPEFTFVHPASGETADLLWKSSGLLYDASRGAVGMMLRDRTVAKHIRELAVSRNRAQFVRWSPSTRLQRTLQNSGTVELGDGRRRRITKTAASAGASYCSRPGLDNPN